MFDNLCLFAHFDQDDLVADYVIYYLEALRATGFEIVVISTSRLSEKDISRLRSVSHDVILRENRGHDFASWGLGIERYAGQVSGQLMIANDSVYGPIGDLNHALARLTSVSADFYGMIESPEIAPHLQSWLIIFEPAVYNSSAFRAVFAQEFQEMAKVDIIQKGEIDLSQSLIASGFSMRSLFDGTFENGKKLNIPSNYSHFLWWELVEIANIPFLKIELLRVNPCRIASLHKWKDIVIARRPELVPMIEDHLVRTSKGRQHTIPYLHNLPARRRDLQFFVKRDYFLAASGRRFAGRANLIYLQFQKTMRGLMRRIYYIGAPLRQRMRK
ncbi:rhamnan synthesis F family protein [Methylobacterium marchantiae]|uniref:Rhamnan synthesis F family protein n=1 Tax=Methylobacterium marchantiae TaxID=600331 RepID=A0ABW3X537_9HYPH|nr:hypothetical protein AIGOOFII_1660 [Methylobacterium marchantiae]